MAAFLPSLFMALSALALLVAIAAVWSSLRALLGSRPEQLLSESAALRRRGELLIEKQAVLRSLKDLEFEHAVGKIGDEDFARAEAQFRQRAKGILRALDDDLKEHREKAVALLRQDGSTGQGT